MVSSTRSPGSITTLKAKLHPHRPPPALWAGWAARLWAITTHRKHSGSLLEQQGNGARSATLLCCWWWLGTVCVTQSNEDTAAEHGVEQGKQVFAPPAKLKPQPCRHGQENKSPNTNTHTHTNILEGAQAQLSTGFTFKSRLLQQSVL